ncbi:hypothetical protein FKM82_007933 [Ascaphus truei]
MPVRVMTAPSGDRRSIHIRIQQRTGRQTLTAVQGIADDYDKKKLVKAFKCNISSYYLSPFRVCALH